MVSWISALGNLRFIKRSRLLMTYIKQGIIDMIPFLLVMIMILTGSTCAIYFKQSQSDQTEFAKEERTDRFFTDMLTVYNFIISGSYSNIDDTENTLLNNILFIVITFFAYLIMLSLLISIITKAQDDVIEHQDKKDYCELNNIILELEYLLKANRNSNDRHHLIYAEQSTWKDVSELNSDNKHISEVDLNGRLDSMEKT